MAGVRTVWFCVSSRVSSPQRFIHVPTGCLICVLPAPALYRTVRRRVLNPYAPSVEQAVGDVHGVRRIVFASLKEVSPYLSTPIWLFARELRREGCKAILCQEYENPRFDVCVLLGRLMRLPVFATFQGGQTQYSRVERLFRSLTIRSCAGLVVGSQSESRRVSTRYNVPAAKVARIFNPVDARMWRPLDRQQARADLGIPVEARAVVWHGRVLLYRKGLDILLEAWKEVCRERPGIDLRLILLGTGNDSGELRRRLDTMRLQGILWVDKFLVDRAAIVRHLSAADVYVFPSRHEGFPVAPIEAMSSSLAVVAATAPGIQDIFEGGEASGGLLVPVGDATALAGALGRLLDNVSFAHELGLRAQSHAQAHFSLEAIGTQLKGFFEAQGVRL
jgi:glycosyltransferase involved in cell wall biosynthesis